MAEEQNDGKPATTIIYPVAIIAFDDQNFDDIAGSVGARNYQTEFRTVFVGSHNIETVVLVKCENCEPLQR